MNGNYRASEVKLVPPFLLKTTMRPIAFVLGSKASRPIYRRFRPASIGDSPSVHAPLSHFFCRFRFIDQKRHRENQTGKFSSRSALCLWRSAGSDIRRDIRICSPIQLGLLLSLSHNSRLDGCFGRNYRRQLQDGSNLVWFTFTLITPGIPLGSLGMA